jgi:hypothetical protein
MSENIFDDNANKDFNNLNTENNLEELDLKANKKSGEQKVEILLNQFIKIIDVDNLSPEELLRIIAAVGSKNIAYYLALIVNLENRSRKISPVGVTKILSSKSMHVPNSNPAKIFSTADTILKNNDLNKV